jgi:hypothetical protein
MVYFLPNEFMAPANQVVQEETSLDVNDNEQLWGTDGATGVSQASHLRQTGQKSTHKAVVLEGIRQWQAIDQDVC